MTGPIADLCADIRAHPGEYEWDLGAAIPIDRIRNKTDKHLAIGRHSYVASGEEKLVREAFAAFEEHMYLALKAQTEATQAERRRDLADRLAKVKAGRNRYPNLGAYLDEPLQPVTLTDAERDAFRVQADREPNTRWTDLDGNPHPTRAAMRAADKAIKARRAGRKRPKDFDFLVDKPKCLPLDKPMRRGG
ncbi:hypothetical protein [Roseicella sp. DB1501]|uniref:hypothetical protein n=1 Tax=Roseicella sp. DB1501 TaxID=2730925 RepID=UPI0014915C0F|nr:hypothetical protein [Roseicella sp. DB1501]NOG73752.1 hypothetical protein [Roseicella sp. DB1501]